MIRIHHILDWLGSRWFWIHGILSCTVSANCARHIRAAAHPVDDIWRVLSKQQVKFICKTVSLISISFLVPFFLILIDQSYSFSSVPVWLIWFKYIGWFLYTNELLTINQWEGLDINTCENVNITTPSTMTTESTTLPVTPTQIGNRFCFTSGDEVISYLDFEKVTTMGKEAG